MESTPETMCEGQYLRLVRRGHWEYAERTNAGSAVIVIAVTPERKLLFVEQFRIPLGAPTIEMPAGLVGDLDAADTMEEAARRELLELASNGYLRATVHRVVSPPAGSERLSVAFFLGAQLDAVVPLYPLPPLLFAGATGYMMWFLVGQRPQELMWGGVTLLVGGVLYAGLRGWQESVSRRR